MVRSRSRRVRHPDGLNAPPVRSRIAAAGALAVSAVTLAALAVLTAGALRALAASLLACVLCITALRVAATNRQFRRVGVAGAVVFVGGTIAGLVAAERGAVSVAIVIAGIVISAALGAVALHWEIQQALAEHWYRVPAARHGVILINPRSGDGKPTRLHLADEAQRRGIEPVLLEKGDDLRALAEAAVTRGADALGMAGGDGSQAVVAAVAAAHGLPYVCIPAGTRNHLALDLGVDRRHPVRALDAFGPAQETAIDLAEVNGEVFVNNVSLGIYAHFVASPEYREAKRRTVAEMLPGLLAPDAKPFGFTVEGADEVADPRIILVSNNPYTLSSLSGFGSRARLDTGALGVATLSINRASDLNRLAALEIAGHPERFEGWRQWTAPDLVVEGPHGSAAVAMDGEARTWDLPLHFRIRPKALRIRIALGQLGASPAFLRSPALASTVMGLSRVVRGRPSGIVLERSEHKA
jgi:diacylglycerol kinase family enzyme